jgi:hypothetical protein
MMVEIECCSAEQLDQYLKMGVDVGTSQTLDNLVAYARTRSAAVGVRIAASLSDGDSPDGLRPRKG